MTETPRGRIIALDLLRGFVLAVIAIDHIARFPNLFELASGRGILWVSAAEGFFIISGLLVGYLYTRRMQRSPLAAVKKIWRRALLLYALSIFWTLTFTLWAWAASGNAGVKGGVWQGDSAGLVWQLLTLQYVYGWADFLAYYTLFMLVAPLAVWLISKKQAWLVVVLSLAVWVFFRSASFALAWQVLFMLAMVAGAYLPQLEAFARTLPEKVRSVSFYAVVMSMAMFLLISAAVVIVLPFLAKHQLLGTLQVPVTSLLASLNSPGGLLSWFNKDSLPLGRLIAAFFVFTAFYLLFRRFETQLLAATKGVLEILGKQSLFVYCTQAVMVFVVNLLLPPRLNPLLSTLLTASLLVLLYWLAKGRESSRPRSPQDAQLTLANTPES